MIGTNLEPYDLSNVLPQGVSFKIGKIEYNLIYDYGAIKRLSDIYGSVNKALDALRDRDKMYDTIVNFLYAGLCDKYKIKKTDVEGWIGFQSANLMHDIVFEAVMASFGKPEADGDAEDDQPGEADGGTTLT